MSRGIFLRVCDIISHNNLERVKKVVVHTYYAFTNTPHHRCKCISSQGVVVAAASREAKKYEVSGGIAEEVLTSIITVIAYNGQPKVTGSFYRIFKFQSCTLYGSKQRRDHITSAYARHSPQVVGTP
uniref:NTF2 domain-containing protein n=1 Tax=Nippostrongylus brasiliensis TaxID=27835 RepID=A0A0N4YR34_NIPBR